MVIQVNGERREQAGPLTVLALLEGLGVRPEAVAVEKNLHIVPRDRLGSEMIHEGDTIEIIRMVGGG